MAVHMIVRKSYHAATAILLIVSLGILGGSCSDNLTGPPNPGNAFRLSVSVRDQHGQPVPWLRVSAWNLIRTSSLEKISPLSIKSTFAAAAIEFALPQQSHVNLLVSELNGTVLDTLISGDHNAGFYSVLLSVNMNAGCRVLKCMLEAGNFRDSIYAVLWQPDPAFSILGYTSSTGRLTSDDSLSFPNLFSHRSLPETSLEGPTVVGSISISDSVAVCLTDTAAAVSQTYRIVVHHGMNDVVLNWDSPASARLFGAPKGLVFTKGVYADTIPGILPTNYALYQNYPNPFN